jgi:tetratricopeptide (TPR) repeat protein
MNRHERRGQAKQHAQLARRRGGVAVERTGGLLAAAIGHHDGGRLDEAEALYREVLALDAEHPDALHRLGVLAHQRGLNEQGAGLIRQAISVTPDVAAFHANWGGCSSAGAVRRRKPRCDERSPSTRGRARARNLGVVLHAQQRLDEAEASFRAALERAPRHADAHSNLGRALHAQGRFDEAVASYRQALALTPDVADIHNNHAVSLKVLGRLDEAIASYRHALALEPAHVTTHVNLGLALQAQGELVEAMECFLRAATLAPDPSEALMHLRGPGRPRIRGRR